VAATRICDVLLTVPELAAASVVAAYLDTGGEPGTGPLLTDLAARPALQLLLPVQRHDGYLDWAAYDGASALQPGPNEIREPTGARLGVDAVGVADVLVVPALAVDRRGNRLGQGGGGYDRALRQTDPAALTIAVVYDEELLDEVPTELHDVAVRAVVTPSGLMRFAPSE
jgi:5-formyltetrahydrofolate cyclo-ligase